MGYTKEINHVLWSDTCNEGLSEGLGVVHNSCKYNKKSHGDSLKYAFWARSTDDPLVNFDIFFMISADYIV